MSEDLWWDTGRVFWLLTDLLLLSSFLLLDECGEEDKDANFIESTPEKDRKIEDPRMCRDFFVLPAGESMIPEGNILCEFRRRIKKVYRYMKESWRRREEIC